MTYRYLLLILSITINLYGFCQNAEIIDHTTHIEIKANKLTYSISKTIQINNRNGEEYCTISIPFTKKNNIINLKASIEDTYGNTLRKLKKDDYKDVSSISQYALFEDDFVRKFTLKHNSYPYIIKYSYKYSYKEYFYIGNWYPVKDLELPIKKASLNVKLPADLKYNIISNKINKPITTEINGVKNLIWETSYDGLLESEIFCGDMDDFLPYVVILPEKFTYINEGSNESWKTLGNYFNTLNKDTQDLPSKEINIIKSLTKNLESDYEKIKIIYNYLQNNCRYINVSIKEGGLVPYPASYVVENKFGDCKALSIYMKSLLSVCEINSYYTLVYSGRYAPLIKENIVNDKFNHAILCVPLQGDTLWLENTSGSIPLNYLGTQIQNRKALIIKESDSHLVNIPALKPKNVLNERIIKTSLSENRIAAEAVIINRGYNYERTNSFANYLNVAEQNLHINEIVSIKNSSIDKWEIIENLDDSAKNQLNLDLMLPYTIQKYGDDIFLNPFPMSIPKFEKPIKRKLPVKIPYPIYLKDSIIYFKNSYYQQILSSNNFILTGDYGHFTIKSYDTDSTIIITKKMLIHSRNYSFDQYPEFYDFINQVYNANRKLIRITNK